MPPGLREDITKPKIQMRRKSSLLDLLNEPLSERNVLIWPDDTNGWRINIPYQHLHYSHNKVRMDYSAGSLIKHLKCTSTIQSPCKYLTLRSLWRLHLPHIHIFLCFDVHGSLFWTVYAPFLCLTYSYSYFKCHWKISYLHETYPSFTEMN